MAPKPHSVKLPEIYRYAMWHPDSGLIVCPLSGTLPNEIAADDKFLDSVDFEVPHYITDDLIYLAFSSRRPIRRSNLFSVLDLTSRELSNAIVPVDFDHATRYILDETVMRSWAMLEDSLIEVAFSALVRHRQSVHFPELKTPFWPRQGGYRDDHRTYEIARDAVKHSRNQFSILASYVTFCLSLWLTSCRSDCWDEVFTMLATRTVDPLPRSWLALLQDSVVCDISPGLRPGAFLDPATTRWGPMLYKFTRASVPIWLVWGHELERLPIDPSMATYYLPPPNVIELAKQRELRYADVVLPHIVLPHHQTYRFVPGPNATVPATGPPIHIPDSTCPTRHDAVASLPYDEPDRLHVDLDVPPPPPPAIHPRQVVNEHARQRPGEMWPEFCLRMESEAEKRKTIESPQERLARESRALHAKNHGYSKSSEVYEWEQDYDDTTFYRRTRISKFHAKRYWEETDNDRKRYWPHINEWDLFPPLSEQPNTHQFDCCTVPMESSGDILQKPPSAPVGSRMLEMVQVIVGDDGDSTSISYHPRLFSVLEYVRLRHGFYADYRRSWNPGQHASSSDKVYLTMSKWHLVALRLLHEDSMTPELSTAASPITTSLLDFYNTAINERMTSQLLPEAWDISRCDKVKVSCNQDRIKLQIVHSDLDGAKDLYVLRPPEGSTDISPWFIATTSATVVLLVYRSTSVTMLEIARGLLELGIPFRTVVEIKNFSALPERVTRRSRVMTEGLGFRPLGFTPQAEDFLTYRAACDEILRSPTGRAIRLQGGIVGRIAADIVPDVDVLDGPMFRNEVVGHLGTTAFVDDRVDDESLDVIAGVYHIKSNNVNDVLRNASYWPRHATWMSSGIAGDQWSPAAEKFYQTRLDEFRANKTCIKAGNVWRQSLKLGRNYTKRVLEGSERLAAGFLKNRVP